MKLAKSFLVAGSLLALTSVASAAQQTPPQNTDGKEIQIAVSDAYVPGGFDSNSDAFVVTNGMFPNGCYRWGRAEVSNLPDRVHEVKTFAKVQQGMCLMVLVPFTKEVQLGKLDQGTHKVRFVNADGTFIEKQLNVE